VAYFCDRIGCRFDKIICKTFGHHVQVYGTYETN
jgi:hypothetical protein